MTGPELKRLRADLSEALGQDLTVADMAKLCGLPAASGTVTIRRWEVRGPSASAATLLGVLAMASERYPTLDKSDISDRHTIAEKDRPAQRKKFREQMREEVRRRLA